MRTILVGLVALTVLIAPSLVFAAGRQAVEPTGAAREAQYKKAVEWCKTKFGGQYAQYNVVAHWQSHFGKTGWYCAI